MAVAVRSSLATLLDPSMAKSIVEVLTRWGIPSEPAPASPTRQYLMLDQERAAATSMHGQWIWRPRRYSARRRGTGVGRNRSGRTLAGSTGSICASKAGRCSGSSDRTARARRPRSGCCSDCIAPAPAAPGCSGWTASARASPSLPRIPARRVRASAPHDRPARARPGSPAPAAGSIGSCVISWSNGSG